MNTLFWIAVFLISFVCMTPWLVYAYNMLVDPYKKELDAQIRLDQAYERHRQQQIYPPND